MPNVIAIDPGRAKCGVAVLSTARSRSSSECQETNGPILEQGVIPTPLIASVIASMIGRYEPEAVVIGDGTGSAPIREAIDAVRGPVPLFVVDESHSSEHARARYLAENPPVGFRRLLPSFLRSPESAYDDYVAVILAERWLARRDTVA